MAIIIPGFCGSGPDHWQTYWEAADPSFVRFAPASWERPDLDDWLAALDRAIAQSNGPALLVAHSLGCLLVAHWAARRDPSAVSGAMLVAPPDPDGPDFPPELAGFRGVPMQRLPFPALLVWSSDEPYATPLFNRNRATAWGAGEIEAGAFGHIDSESGLADWPQGRALLTAFRAGLRV